MLVSFCIIVPLRTLQANAQFQAIDGNVTSIARLKTYLNIASVGLFPPSALNCRNCLISGQFPLSNSLSLSVFPHNDITVSTQLNSTIEVQTHQLLCICHLKRLFCPSARTPAHSRIKFYLIRNGIMHKNRSFSLTCLYLCLVKTLFANFF